MMCGLFRDISRNLSLGKSVLTFFCSSGGDNTIPQHARGKLTAVLI